MSDHARKRVPRGSGPRASAGKDLGASRGEARYSSASVLAHDSYLRSQEASVDYCNERVDGQGRLLYIDRDLSVSASIEIENDFAYDPTHIELNEVLHQQVS